MRQRVLVDFAWGCASCTVTGSEPVVSGPVNRSVKTGHSNIPEGTMHRQESLHCYQSYPLPKHNTLYKCCIHAEPLFSHSVAEASSKEDVTAARLPHGAAELCDKGNMTANTSSHVQPGSSITLSCQLKPQQYSKQCRIAIFYNSSEQNSSYSSSVSTRFLVHTYGKHMFTCKILCEYGKKLICGIDIDSGSKEVFIIPCS